MPKAKAGSRPGDQGHGEKPLKTARLQWRNGQPLATDFDDIYFSHSNGLAETQHVFINANQLPERWRQLPPGALFSLGETGFGTGLNFLCTAMLWLEIAPGDALLHYLSAEKFPLHGDDMAQALQAWPELAPLARELLANYPPAVPGFHRLWLYGNRIALTLLYGDATEQFQQLADTDHPLFVQQQATGISQGIDAWFLDGFAPAKNPDLWTPALFRQMALLSKPGASFATFTAAGDVRRGLAEAGFTVTKAPGFGHKRDMLTGHLSASKQPQPNARQFPTNAHHAKHPPPWYLASQTTKQTGKDIAIIGGGIAGCSLAAALARRGFSVSLLERHAEPASEASGNPQAVIYPKLSPQASPLSRFNLAALLFASRYYRDYWHSSSKQHSLGQCGVLVLPETPQEQEQFLQITSRYQHNPDLVQLMPKEQLEAVSGLPLASHCGLYFPQLGWINPPAICRQLLDHPNIQRQQLNIDQLEYGANQWHLYSQQKPVLAVSQVVLAAGYSSKAFTQTHHLPLKTLRGQISIAPATAITTKLKTVLCGAGYITPAQNGVHTLGASYNPGETSLSINEKDHRENMERLGKTDALFAQEPLSITGGRAAMRCVSPDYLPLAGPAPIAEYFKRDYAPLRKNARAPIAQAGSYWPGLYLSCGYGSRGMSYAPLAAEMLADHIAGLLPPLPLDLRITLNPARFLIRALKRNQVDY